MTEHFPHRRADHRRPLPRPGAAPATAAGRPARWPRWCRPRARRTGAGRGRRSGDAAAAAAARRRADGRPGRDDGDTAPPTALSTVARPSPWRRSPTTELVAGASRSPPTRRGPPRRRTPACASHPFPTCFACGTGREAGDGLRIFPGRVADDGRPPGSRRPGRRTRASPRTGTTYVDDAAGPACRHLGGAGLRGRLGRRHRRAADGARQDDRAGRLAARGRRGARRRRAAPAARDGRKTFTATTLYDADGRLVGRAEHVWIAVDPAPFN